MTTFVNIPSTLNEMRAQLVNEYEKDKLTLIRLENTYFKPETSREWCVNERPDIKRLEKDLSEREEAIIHLERALRILSKGEYDYRFDRDVHVGTLFCNP